MTGVQTCALPIVDRRDLDLVASCFTADAVYEGALGRGTIIEALATLRTALPRYLSTLHFLGNQVIELDGDTARSETYALAYHRLVGERSLVVAVRYLDEFVRRGEGWLICGRVACTEWRRYDGLVLPANS